MSSVSSGINLHHPSFLHSSVRSTITRSSGGPLLQPFQQCVCTFPSTKFLSPVSTTLRASQLCQYVLETLLPSSSCRAYVLIFPGTRSPLPCLSRAWGYCLGDPWQELPAVWDSGELDGLTVSLHIPCLPRVRTTDFPKIDGETSFNSATLSGL